MITASRWGPVYLYDLNALLSAVAARGFDLLTEAMERGLSAGEGDPLQRLQGVGTAYVRFAVDRPALFRLMFSGRWRDTAPYPELESAEERAFREGNREKLVAACRGIAGAL